MPIERIITLALVAVLSLCLIVLLGTGIREDTEAAARLKEAERLARPYQSEILDLRMTISRQERASVYTPASGSLLVGFVPTAKEDIPEIMDLTQSYSFKPVVILDCEQDAAVLADILAALDSSAVEVLLMGASDSDQILSAADTLRAAMPRYGFTGQTAFLLRGGSLPDEMIDHLYSLGYSPILRYDNSLRSGVTASGVPCLAYAMTTGTSTPGQILALIDLAGSAALQGFEFSRIAQGELTRGTIIASLITADRQVTAGKLSYCTLAQAQETVLFCDAQDKAMAADFSVFREQQLARISELEAIISDIYDRYK